MRKLILIAFVALSGIYLPSLSAQESKSPAELLPASTLAYTEIRQPGLLAKELRQLVEASALGNMPDSLVKVRAKYEKFLMRHHGEELGVAGMIFSAEVAEELQRVQGAAVALTGIGAQGPDFVVVIQPGQSHVPHFFLRLFLTMERTRIVDTVEGVNLYRMYFSFGPPPVIPDAKEGQGPNFPAPPNVREHGPVFAQMPGLILIGSPTAVKDVINRAKGKARGPVLAEEKTFQEASREIGQKPGLFAFVQPQNLQLPEGIRTGMAETVALTLVKTWQKVAFSLSLEQGTIQYREIAQIDPKYKEALADLYPPQRVDLNMFHFAPGDAVLAIGLGNAEGGKRWQKILELADENFPNIQGKKPSEHLKDLEGNVGINVGKEILEPITGLAFALGDPMKAKVKRVEVKGPNFHSVSTGPEIPVVVILQAKNEQAAQDLLKLLAKVAGLTAGENVEPTTEKVNGQEIQSVKLGRGTREMVFYGRKGSTLVLGPFAEPVANALAAGEKQQGLLADATVAARLKDFAQPLMVGALKPVNLLTGLFLVRASGSARMGPPVKTAPAVDFKKIEVEKKLERNQIERDVPRLVPPGSPIAFQDKDPPPTTTTVTVDQGRGPEEERILKRLGEILNTEAGLTIGVTRKEDRLLVHGKMPGLDKIVPQLIDFGIEEFFRSQAQAEERRQGGGGKVVLTLQDQLTQNDPLDQVRRNSRCKIHVFKMEAGRTYTIDMVSHKDAFFDNYLRFEDAAGNQLAQDDDSGGGLNARIVFHCNRGDNYRIIATSLGPQGGSYTLTVREKTEP